MDNSSSREPYCRCTACAAQASTAGGTSNTAVQRPHTSSSSRPRTTMQATRSRCSTAATACSRGGSSGSSSGCSAVLPPEGAWLCVTGSSGQPLDHWDLHVGAELNLLGRKVVLKRVSVCTGRGGKQQQQQQQRTLCGHLPHLAACCGRCQHSYHSLMLSAACPTVLR